MPETAAVAEIPHIELNGFHIAFLVEGWKRACVAAREDHWPGKAEVLHLTPQCRIGVYDYSMWEGRVEDEDGLVLNPGVRKPRVAIQIRYKRLVEHEGKRGYRYYKNGMATDSIDDDGVFAMGSPNNIREMATMLIEAAEAFFALPIHPDEILLDAPEAV